ncbi:MAG: hypothetical protein LC792_04950 [Actinobacteria bacterium]|nr:hypothetical protein [Actinomycetota bacterium]
MDGRRVIDDQQSAGGSEYWVRPTMAAVGGALVAVRDGHAVVVSAEADRPNVDLGPAEAVFASHQVGAVWMVQPGEPNEPVLARQKVPPDTAVVARLTFPAETLPLAETAAGFVTSDYRAGLDLRTAGGTSVHLSGDASFIAASAEVVVWRSRVSCPDGTCALHVYDVRGKTQRTVAPPAGAVGFVDGGAISPDGMHLAVFAELPPHGGPQGALVLVDLSDLASTIVPGQVGLRAPFGRVAWAPSGPWVFYAGSVSDIMAYRLGDRTPSALNIRHSGPFAALPR